MVKIFKLKKNDKKNLFFLLQVRNKKYVRINSLNKKKISIKDHITWLKSYFRTKENKIFIIQKKEKNIGYIRLQKKRNLYEVSWALLKKYKGKNISSQVLKKITNNSKLKFSATIQKKNLASIKVAKNAGFNLVKKNEKIFRFLK